MKKLNAHNIVGVSLLSTFILLLILFISLKIIFPKAQFPYSTETVILFFLGFGFILSVTLIALFHYSQKSFQKEQKHTSQLPQHPSDKDKQIDWFQDREKYRREFLGNVSHELKTPLFAIQGYLLTLIEGGAIKDKLIRDKYLERINKSVERLIYIVQDLDMLAELESGNLNLHLEFFNLKRLSQSVFDLLEMKAKEKNVALVLKDFSKGNKVRADKEKISQVLTNLVMNAIAYSNKKNGIISIEISEQEADYITLEVIDNGIGISSHHLPRIFERFYRTDEGRSREFGGSGLGLSIVKNILEAHQTTIEVESQEGKGTKFSFKLPTSPSIG